MYVFNFAVIVFKFAVLDPLDKVPLETLQIRPRCTYIFGFLSFITAWNSSETPFVIVSAFP